MPRPTWSRTVYICALGLWLGALVMTGVAAAVTFPALKSLTPTLPAFAAYPNTDAAHGVIAGGHVVSRLFLISDAIQFACLCVAIVTTLVVFIGLRRRNLSPPPAFVVRAALIGLLVAVLAYQLFVLAPGMKTTLMRFWSLAQKGDVAGADAARAAFDADHPIASTVMAVSAAAVAVLLVLATREGAASGARANEAPPPSAASDRLEAPALLRGAR